MIVNSTTQFERALRKLDKPLRNQVLQKVEIFKSNWQDPRLKTHKLSGSIKDIWAFRVNYSVRVIFIFEKDTVILLLDVGSHEGVYK